MDRKLSIAITAVIVVLIAIGFFVWWKYYRPAPVPAPAVPTAEEPQTLGGQIYEQVQNPAERLPETNPFEAKVNPFEEAKTNPYKDVYKNPFE